MDRTQEDNRSSPSIAKRESENKLKTVKSRCPEKLIFCCVQQTKAREPFAATSFVGSEKDPRICWTTEEATK